MSCAKVQFAEAIRRFFLWKRRLTLATFAACIAAVAGAAGQARAEDDVLKLVPDKALGFAIVNRLEATNAKLQEFGQQMKLPVPGSRYAR